MYIVTRMCIFSRMFFIVLGSNEQCDGNDGEIGDYHCNGIKWKTSENLEFLLYRWQNSSECEVECLPMDTSQQNSYINHRPSIDFFDDDSREYKVSTIAAAK